MGKTLKRKSFIFNVDWQEILLSYPAEVRLEVYDAIIEYVASGTLLELKPMAKMAFSFIKKEIDFNEEKYQETINKRSEAGKKGMKSRYQNYQKVTNVTNDNKANKSYQKVTNVTDNDNDNDNDNDIKKELSNDNSKESVGDDEFDKFWNLYDKKRGDKTKIKTKFLKLSKADRAKIFETLPTYVANTPDKSFRKDPQTYLNNRSWEDEIIPRGLFSQSQQQHKADARLGVGEWIDSNGRRTYGSGKATIPMDAPPRPSERYSWNASNNKWIIL